MSSTDSLEEEGFFCESLATFYPSSISADSGYDTNRSSLSIELSEAEHEGARRRAAFKASDESMERFLEDCREFMLDFESDPECHGGTELDDYIQEAEDLRDLSINRKRRPEVTTADLHSDYSEMDSSPVAGDSSGSLKAICKQ